MQYRVYICDNRDSFSEDQLENLISRGYFCVFFKDTRKIYDIYRTRPLRRLTENWRRGLSITRNLAYLEKMNSGTVKSIRREDFKSIISGLRGLQQRNESQLNIIVAENQVNLVRQQADVYHTSLIEFNYRRFAFFADRLFELFQNSVLNGAMPWLELQTLRQQVLRSFTELAATFHNVAKSERIILSGSSFKNLAAFTWFFKHLANGAISLPGDSEFSHIPAKTRRVLIVSNLNGPMLNKLSEDIEFWSSSRYGLASKHIYTRLTAARAIKLFFQSGTAYDMIIYRGHSQVIDGLINIPVEDGMLPLQGLIAPNYIHLSCIDMQGSEDLGTLPFKQGIMPLSYLPDESYFNDVDALFRLMSQGLTFFNAFRRLKAEGRFSLMHFFT